MTRAEICNGLQEISSEAYSRWVNHQYTRDKLIIDIGTYVGEAIKLLKEQEPMKPGEVFQDGSYYASCGDCGYPLTELTKQHGWPRFDWPPFCSNCGRKVKWNAND